MTSPVADTIIPFGLTESVTPNSVKQMIYPVFIDFTVAALSA